MVAFFLKVTGMTEEWGSHFSRILMVHILSQRWRKGKIQKCEAAPSKWTDISIPIFFLLLIWFNRKHVLGSVCSQWDYLMEKKEMARISPWDETIDRRRGKDLVFRHAFFWQVCHQSHLLWLRQRAAVWQAWKKNSRPPQETLQHNILTVLSP